MPKLWLPLKQSPLVPREVYDEQTGQRMLIFMPRDEFYESRQQKQELEEWAETTAKAQMVLTVQRKQPEEKVSREEISLALQDFLHRLKLKKNRTAPRRYEFGWGK